MFLFPFIERQWSSSPGVFSGYSGFLPSFISYWFKSIKKNQINAISTLSNLISFVPLGTLHNMLHMISARCVARDLHTIAPGPLERTCRRVFAAQWRHCKKSRFSPLNVIIIKSTVQFQQNREVTSWLGDDYFQLLVPLSPLTYKDCVRYCNLKPNRSGFVAVIWHS